MSPARALAGLVAAAACLGYAGTLGHDFVWDDTLLIQQSAQLRRLDALPGLLTSHFWADTEERSPYYRPLVTLTFALDARLWGMRPAGFHLTNLVAHVLVSLGVLALARRLALGMPGAALAGILFALHPIHAESVAFVSGRTDIVATLFLLLAVLAYARWRARGGFWASTGALSAFAFALAAKEVAVTLPAILLAWDWAHRPAPGEPARPRPGVGSAAVARGVARHLPFLGVLAGYVAVRALVLAEAPGTAPVAAWATLPVRLLTTVETVAGYAWATLVPFPPRPYVLPGAVAWPPPAAWWVALAWLAGLLALTALALRHRPLPAFAVLWFWLALAPATAGTLLAGAGPLAAERLLYLPSVGFCVLAGAGLGRALEATAVGRQTAWRSPVAASIALLVLVYALLTLWRNEDWRDNERLYTRMVEVAPEAPMPRINLALTQIPAGAAHEAGGHLRRALELAPGSPRALVGLALTETLAGRGQAARALAREAVQRAPQSATVLATAGAVYLHEGEPAEAAVLLETSLRLLPDQLHPTLNLAAAYARLGQGAAADRALARALDLAAASEPDLPIVDRIAAEVPGRGDPARAARAWERYAARLRTLDGARSGAHAAELARAEGELARLRGAAR